MGYHSVKQVSMVPIIRKGGKSHLLCIVEYRVPLGKFVLDFPGGRHVVTQDCWSLPRLSSSASLESCSKKQATQSNLTSPTLSRWSNLIGTLGKASRYAIISRSQASLPWWKLTAMRLKTRTPSSNSMAMRTSP